MHSTEINKHYTVQDNRYYWLETREGDVRVGDKIYPIVLKNNSLILNSMRMKEISRLLQVYKNTLPTCQTGYHIVELDPYTRALSVNP